MEIMEYLERVLKEIKPKKIIEVGFGDGNTANLFQLWKPEVHIIIESDYKNFKELEQWRDGKDNVIPVYIPIEKYYYKDAVDLIFDSRCATNTEWLNEFKFAHYISHFFWEMRKNE